MSGARSGSPPTAPSRGRSWWKRRRADLEPPVAPAPSPVRRGCESIELQGSGDRALLLLHGFGDTPQTFSYLAPALHQAGYTVHAPLLPGHGRSVEDFARTTGEEWLAAGRAALRDLSYRYDTVGLCGLSMGGALAILLAAEAPSVRAVVLIAPYVDMPRHVAAVARTHRIWGRLLGVVGSGSTRSVRDPVERARNLGYGRATGRLLHELWLTARKARQALPQVRQPTLVIQSREDNRIRPRVAEGVVARLGSPEKRLIFTAGAGHIITVDYGREQVITEVRDWFDAHLGAPVRSVK